MAACDTKFTLYHRVEKMLYGSGCVHRQGEAVQTVYWLFGAARSYAALRLQGLNGNHGK